MLASFIASCVVDDRAWMVQQRFSTLHAMRDKLHAENAELPDVAFPPKQWPLIHLVSKA